MRILFPLGAFYPSQIGGPCNTLYWHTSALIQNGYSVKVVSTMLGINEDSELGENEFHEYYYGNVYYGSGNSNNIRTIFKSIRQVHNSDIIHLNSLFNLLSIVTFFYTRFLYPKKPIIWSVRGELNKNALKYGKTKKKILLALYKLLVKRVHFHGTSKQEIIDIRRAFSSSSSFLVPNLLKTSDRISVPIKNQLLFIGRIHPIKGIDKLLEALKLSDSFMLSDFILIIAGTYEERYLRYYRSLETKIVDLGLTNKVAFIGHVNFYDKELLYASSYATILPSETENFGNVVIESLNQGCPVIASLGTPWEILEDYKCGYHVSNEPEILASALNSIIDKDLKEYKIIRKNCNVLIDKVFNINNQFENWIKLYKTIKNAEK